MLGWQKRREGPNGDIRAHMHPRSPTCFLVRRYSGNYCQRNVSAKASQADVPEAAKSNGLKTTTMDPPQREAG